MKPIKIVDGLYSIGVLNPELRVFDIIMTTEYGTSYNSYLVKGEKSCAIIEAVKNDFEHEYIENIQSLVDLKEVEYLILNHTEPDHSGSVKNILKEAPHIKVVTSKAGHQYIREIVNNDFDARVVTEADELDLGGVKLKFIIAPFLHWPDSMFTYIEEKGVLFPCDAFGTHFCHENMFDSKIEDRLGYERMFKYYYDVIMSPFKEHVLKAIDKIKDLKINIICPSHGPIILEESWNRINKYEEWSKDDVFIKNDPKKVFIAYVSAYGCTSGLATAIADGITSKGIEVLVQDVEASDLAKVKENIEKCDGILFGSPTINKDAVKPIWDVLAMIDAIKNRGKLSAVFGSYGWSGEGIKLMEDRLKGLKLNLVEPSPKAFFVPSEHELKNAYEFGILFASRLNG